MRNSTFSSLCEQLQDHRVVTAEELRTAGADANAIFRARRNGDLQVIPGIDGIYVVGQDPYDDLVRMHIAARVAGDDAVITGLWAARLLGLPWVPAGGACVVRVAGDRHRRGAEGFVDVCRTTSLERVETWEHEGLRIAAPGQAVVDACRQLQEDKATRRPLLPELELRDIRGLVLGAVAAQRTTVAELERIMSRGSIRYTAKIRRALTDGDRGAASPPEAELVDGMLPFGVPFYCNVEIRLEGRLLGVSDLFLLGTGTGAEIDSNQEHAEEEKLDATMVRDDGYKDAGIDLRHITPNRYRRNPDRFHRHLLRVAAERLAAGKGDPPGLELTPRGPLLCGPVTSETPYRLPRAA